MFEQIKQWRLGKQYGYETLFKRQDKHVSGKPGIILAEIGAPEGYEPDFYVRYMEHVFDYTLPPFIQKFVLADRGIALIDPQNPLAREPFDPQQLVDMHGSFVNRNGRPYVDCKVTWKPPGVKKIPGTMAISSTQMRDKVVHQIFAKKRARKWLAGILENCSQKQKLHGRTNANRFMKMRLQHYKLVFQTLNFVMPGSFMKPRYHKLLKNCWNLGVRQSSTKVFATRYIRILKSTITQCLWSIIM